MPIKDFIERAQSLLRQGAFISEAAVSQGILLPALHELGWPVFDTSVVTPEYSIEGRRVDYALCHPPNRPAVFVEVKKTGFSEGADRQLFEYAFHIGVPMAILTDGQEWSFYLPGEQGRYDERRVYKLDLLERSSEEASARLIRYLAYDELCSGEALSAARSDYQNVARDREIEAPFQRHGIRYSKSKTHFFLICWQKKLKAYVGTSLTLMLAVGSFRQGRGTQDQEKPGRSNNQYCLPFSQTTVGPAPAASAPEFAPMIASALFSRASPIKPGLRGKS